MEEFALLDMAAVLLGLRRLGADLGLIQLMQYYATPTPELADPHAPHEEREEHPPHIGAESMADRDPRIRLGNHPRLVDYTLRSAALDPRFAFIYEYGGCALGFNLNRADEALHVFHVGVDRNPAHTRLLLYAGAIAFRKNLEVEKTIAFLEESRKSPECPSMVKNILGNIYLRRRAYARARRVFEDLALSRDREYADLALRRLEELK
jgi:hypothetical protein